MSYIISSTNPFVSVKLTDFGRQKLALGQLNFSYWAIGDSEINYDREAIVDANPTDVTLSGASRIMRPFDRQPNIKYFITPSSTTSQFQAINASNMSVVQATVNNEALERGFFVDNVTGFTTSLDVELTPNYQTIANTNLTGGTMLVLSTATTYNVGDYLMFKLNNDTLTGLTSSDTTLAIPNTWYQIQTVASNTVTVDRNLPIFSSFTASSFVFVYRSGEVYDSIATGNTTAYWDSGTLSFNSNINITCDDVPVWNMNNVWCENLAGMTGNTTYEDYTKFGSYQYLGAKNPYYEYLCANSASTVNFNCNGPGISYPDDVSKSISIIHYTNNAISNLYGEFLYVDATSDKIVKVHLPNLMYHRAGYTTSSGTTMGMTFIASGSTNLLGTSDIEYIDLIEHPDFLSTANTTTLVVGKVFPQLKTIVFDNDEIVAAMSYKANRNWTLPPLAANITPPSGGTSTGVLEPNKTIYLTYAFENNFVSGLTNTLPCQDYIKVTNNSSSAKDITFRIQTTDLLPYMRKIENVDYDGFGFYADTFKLLYQIVDDETQRPDSAAWKTYDYTSTGITETVNETINPFLLENQTPGGVNCGQSTGFILDLLKDASATDYNLYPILNMAPNNQPTYLQFGDERFFYGNLETFIGARIYKTIFDIRVNSGLFDTTTNPTRSTDESTNPADIRISEVGIYDSSENLVCIGKLSKPVLLSTGNTIMLELALDF